MSGRLLLDTFRGRLRLEGRVTTRTGLHIGSGGSGDMLGTDAPIIKDATGVPFIPGSSLKGVLRSAAEALLRSAGDSEQLCACDQLVRGRACVDHQRLAAIREELESRQQKEQLDGGRTTGEDASSEDVEEPPSAVDALVAEKAWDESCTVCRLFGSPALAGRVRFPDLPLIGSAPVTDIRNGVGIDRDKELAAKGVLYDFEAVPPGVSFLLTVVFDNPTDWEVGLLLYLFEELDNGNIALGGKTTRGLGQVGVSWSRIEETTLHRSNPFASMLSSMDLLSPAPESAETEDGPEAEAVEARDEQQVPESGDPEAWRELMKLIEELGTVDKSLLGQRASGLGFSKSALNEKLDLGLEKPRKAWDVVINRLRDVGFLVEKDGETVVASVAAKAEADVAAEAEIEAQPKEPALQAVIDRFVGAMARKWTEVVECSPDS